MTTFINARFLCQPLSGVQRFSGEILDALDRQLTSDPAVASAIGPVVALCPNDVLRQPSWRYITLRELAGGRGHIWEQGPLYRASKAGTLVSLGNSGPVRHPAHILALHDANIWEIPEAFTTRYRLFHKALRPVLAARAKQLLTVSAFSAGALSRRMNIPVDRFSIVPNGADHVMRAVVDPWVLQKHGLHKNGYLLSVGNQSPNKNIANLVAAHAMAGPSVPPLAIVGGLASGIEHQHLEASARVHFLGRVGDGALRSLYEQAAGFVFPSLYEGFGIPPLEAMQLGTPVLAADRTALPEVLQNGAMWFDPTDLSNMAKALRQFSSLSELAKSGLVSRGRQVAAGFTWERSAKLLIRQMLLMKETATMSERGAHTHNAGPLRKAS